MWCYAIYNHTNTHQYTNTNTVTRTSHTNTNHTSSRYELIGEPMVAVCLPDEHVSYVPIGATHWWRSVRGPAQVQGTCRAAEAIGAWGGIEYRYLFPTGGNNVKWEKRKIVYSTIMRVPQCVEHLMFLVCSGYFLWGYFAFQAGAKQREQTLEDLHNSMFG